MPRERKTTYGTRSNPLGDDLHTDRFATARRNNEHRDEEADLGQNFVLPTGATQRILRTAKAQLDAVRDEVNDANYNDAIDNEDENDNEIEERLGGFEDHSGFYEQVQTEDGDVVDLEFDDTESVMSEMPSEMNYNVNDGNAAMHLYGISEEEARLLEKFQPSSRIQSRNLADVISEKIKEQESTARMEQRQAAGAQAIDINAEEKIDERVARVYTAIGTVLKRYTSGKVPKAFKILPNVKNWEQILMLTKPDQWSPHATYQATRIFSANLNERMAQRFYAAVLLPIVHERFVEEKKLHPSLYMAVRKALFKPVAFFKGFLLPLASDEECTLKEALVIASILQKTHLPPVPTAVTIVKLAQMPYSGPVSVFLRVLIDKKMSLPLQAIDALVAYFHRFTTSHPKEEALPVLWHQTLLTFCQRYKNEFTNEQIGLLEQVCGKHFHYMITPETRRELNAAIRQRNTAEV